MVKLLFLQAGKQVDKALIKSFALQINNELLIPMKILDIKEEVKNDKYFYDVEVEDCADLKEWDKAVSLFFIGYDFRIEEQKHMLSKLK